MQGPIESGVTKLLTTASEKLTAFQFEMEAAPTQPPEMTLDDPLRPEVKKQGSHIRRNYTGLYPINTKNECFYCLGY